MFFRTFKRRIDQAPAARESVFIGMENLEDRRMLSAASAVHHPKVKHKAPPAQTAPAKAPTTTTSTTTTGATPAPKPAPAPKQTILFSAAPAAVQAGLQKLAPAGTTIDPSESVTICKRPDGSTVYTTEVSVSGSDVYLSVNASGNPVAPPPPPPPASGTGGGQNAQTIAFSAAPAVVQAGLQKIAPGGTTIDPTEDVKVCTRPDGSKVYTTEVSVNGKDVYFSVDANGNAVQNPPPPPAPKPATSKS